MNPSLRDSSSRGAGAIASYAAVGVILLIVGFYVIDLATPGKLSAVIRTERNPNATLLAASALAAVGLIVAASIWSSGGALPRAWRARRCSAWSASWCRPWRCCCSTRWSGISVRDLVKEPELQPGARLLAVTHVAIGLITAVAVI